MRYGRKEKFPLFHLVLRALWVIVAILLACKMVEYERNSSTVPGVNEGKTVVFSHEFGKRTRITDIDATTEFIYIAYQGYDVIAVYDWDGNYVHSMAFYRGRKGSLGMRCEDDLLYVSDGSNYELVFSGDTLINTYEPSNVLHRKGWYDVETEQPIVVKDGKMYDSMGRYIMELPGRVA